MNPPEKPLAYRWMAEGELPKLADIDRAECIRVGFQMQSGQLVQMPVEWDAPNFFREGQGEHSLAHQIEFCQEHLHAGGQMIGAFDGERLVAVGVLTPKIRPGMAQLAYLHVSQGYRRRGVATRLAQEMFELAIQQGAEQVYVSATPSASAVGFYLNQGFVPTSDPLPELLELEPEDIHMLKNL